ncbi:MBL fold metallo-hydrolase [Paraferrimonas sedimenticola]|uniref:beta-lactamase n=1 Tax=Paraferrimonas sedimenticola TaxID=375674 RepID=A0AA37RR04_9GAMM|nr:MBL fold metallo-hydrolase [Paraferrimonas sedimenticola]GLP94876.1 cyclase [Paraferrimonas sedimenticola]
MKPLQYIRAALILGLAVALPVQADRFANVQIETQSLGNGIYMLTGSGGNIGVSAGEDGLLIIDDQYAPLSEKISKALEQIQAGAPRFVINTHHHGDHTGGNAHFGKTGTIMAHHNVRRHLHADNQPKKALPVLTYDEGIVLHFNQDTIKIEHMGIGHTDGDSLVFWEKANVVHMGDQYFQGRFPFVDLGNGGNVSGYLATVEKVIARIDDKTQVIPGHGPLSNRTELMEFATMIKETQAYVAAAKANGVSEDDAVKQGVQAKYKDWAWGFITEEKWVRTLYQSN